MLPAIDDHSSFCHRKEPVAVFPVSKRMGLTPVASHRRDPSYSTVGRVRDAMRGTCVVEEKIHVVVAGTDVHPID